MAARQFAEVVFGCIRPVTIGKNSRAMCQHGSLSGARPKTRGKFFPANEPLPIALNLHLDMPIEGKNAAGLQQLIQDILLVRPEDPNFACCWLSRLLDLGASCDGQGFWMLQKTARDTWLLCFRRENGAMVVYHLKTRKHGFPITLKAGQVAEGLVHWPRSITVGWAQ